MTKLEVSSSLKLLGVTIDDRLTLEKHICNIASLFGQKSGLIRKYYKTFGNNNAVLKSFYAFILPARLWNQVVLAVKQDHFIVLAKYFL